MHYGSVFSGMFRYLAFVYFLHGNKISVSMTCDGTTQKVAVNSTGLLHPLVLVSNISGIRVYIYARQQHSVFYQAAVTLF